MFDLIVPAGRSRAPFEAGKSMGPNRTSTLAILREKPDVRNLTGFAVGSVLAALGAHTWVRSNPIPNVVSQFSTADQGSGSWIAVLAFLAAALVVGWMCGGWMLESRYAPSGGGDSARHPLGSFLSQLVLVGIVLLLGIALGAWPLMGGLLMVAGAAIGSVARLGHEGFRFLSENC